MQEKFYKIIIILALVLSGFSIYKLYDAKQTIVSLENRINDLQNEVSLLRTELNAYQIDIENDVEQILIDADYKFIKESLDLDELRVDVEFMAMPKEVNTLSSKCYLVDDKANKYPLELVDGRYVNTSSLNLFDTYCIDYFVIDDNGSIQNQSLYWKFTPAFYLLPNFEIQNQSIIETKNANRQVVVNTEMIVDSTENCFNEKHKFNRVDLVAISSGREVDRFSLKTSVDALSAFFEDESVSLNINRGEKICFYIEAQMDDYMVRKFVDSVEIDLDGNRYYSNDYSDYFNRTMIMKYKDDIIYDISGEVEK